MRILSTNMSTNDRRIPYWDNLKGILIILVVLGHTLWEYKDGPIIRSGVYAIYLFHMPAFIFVSGYLSRGKNSSGAESLVKILIWFFLLNFSMMFYAFYIEHKPFSLLNLYYSSWYLLALFLYRLTLPLCREIPFIIPISICISLAVGYLHSIGNVLQLQKIITLYPFFIIGAKLSRERMDDVISLLKRKTGIIWGAFIAIELLSLWLIFSQIIGYNEILWIDYNSEFGLVKRLLSLLIASSIIIILLAITPRNNIPLVNKWGKNSLSIYITHRIFTLLLALLFPKLTDDISGFLWLLIVSFIMLIILGSNTVSRPVGSFLNYFAEVIAPAAQVKQSSIRISSILILSGFLLGMLALHNQLPQKTISYVQSALKTYADDHIYIDPNPGIEKVIHYDYPRKYLIDHIHPNADKGIRMYSEKVLEASPVITGNRNEKIHHEIY